MRMATVADLQSKFCGAVLAIRCLGTHDRQQTLTTFHDDTRIAAV
jgi:hypothetical protein